VGTLEANKIKAQREVGNIESRGCDPSLVTYEGGTLITYGSEADIFVNTCPKGGDFVRVGGGREAESLGIFLEDLLTKRQERIFETDYLLLRTVQLMVVSDHSLTRSKPFSSVPARRSRLK
jgi:hypothetical protein